MKHRNMCKKTGKPTIIGISQTLLLICLLTSCGKEEASPTVTHPPGMTPPQILPAFTDVTGKAGLHFTHYAGIPGKYYYPEVMGAGCAFFDADSDGHLDIYLVNGNKLPHNVQSRDITNALYRNNGDGTFTDMTQTSGAGDAAYGQGCCTADYDGDGDQDLFVTNYGPNALYKNNGNGTFQKVNGALTDPGWGQSAAFFDADRDGDLDLYLQNYLAYSVADAEDWYVVINNRKVKDYCGPQGYVGQQDRLYRNLGNGAFEDVTEKSGIVKPQGTGMGLVTADLDNDGDQDLLVANDSRPNFFFKNDGQGRFSEEALKYGVAYNREGGMEAFMGVEAGDYNNDGLLDLVIPCLRTEGFTLFKNMNDFFSDVSIMTGIDAATSPLTGFGPVFLDYDLDGDLDLFFTCGEVRMGRTPSTSGDSFEDRYAMPDLLLENRDGKYVNVTSFAGSPISQPAISRSCSRGDYDNDGDLDLLVTAMNGRARLLRNDTKGGHWIGLSLKGKKPNGDALGARCRIRAGGLSLMAEVTGGGSYLGQHDRRLLFGLKDFSGKVQATVRWPAGKEQVYDGLQINRYHELVQEK